jgi:flagellar basal-body rod protein FlgG
MLRSLYTAATGMEAEQLKMDTIANNLANVNTTGFKRTRAEFQDLLSETIVQATPAGPNGGGQPAPLQVGLGVRTGTTTRSNAQGDMLTTQNPYDVAIGGVGFFRIQRANGDIAFTRAGNFRVDDTGRLVTQNGEVVDPGITIPTGTTGDPVIASDGTVSVTLAGQTNPQQLGQIELTTFTNPGALQAIGNNLFQPTAASGQEVRQKPGEQGMGSLQQGALESGNVKAVEEMIDMITTQRSYEMNSKVITTADQMLQKLTSLR